MTGIKREFIERAIRWANGERKPYPPITTMEVSILKAFEVYINWGQKTRDYVTTCLAKYPDAAAFEFDTSAETIKPVENY
jgi:hypothetical protein